MEQEHFFGFCFLASNKDKVKMVFAQYQVNCQDAMWGIRPCLLSADGLGLAPGTRWQQLPVLQFRGRGWGGQEALPVKGSGWLRPLAP